MATMAGTVMEKTAPSNIGEPRTKSFLLNKPLEEPAPGVKNLPLMRMNDDIALLFQRTDDLDYKYITGKSNDGKTYVGIMPFGTIRAHTEIVDIISKQFNVALSEIKGGWVMIEDNCIFIHGKSANFQQKDHEMVKKAMQSLVPGIENVSITIGLS